MPNAVIMAAATSEILVVPPDPVAARPVGAVKIDAPSTTHIRQRNQDSDHSTKAIAWK
jgi:hypothetical protein